MFVIFLFLLVNLQIKYVVILFYFRLEDCTLASCIFYKTILLMNEQLSYTRYEQNASGH